MPFVHGHRTVSPRTPRHTCVYTRHPAQCHATCCVLTWLSAKLGKTRKNGMHVKTSADPRLINKLRVYTASDAIWLISSYYKVPHSGQRFHVNNSLFMREYFFEVHDASIFENEEIMAQWNTSIQCSLCHFY